MTVYSGYHVPGTNLFYRHPTARVTLLRIRLHIIDYFPITECPHDALFLTVGFLTSMLSSQDCRLATASSPSARFQTTTYRALSVKKHWFIVDMLAGPPMSHTLKDTEST